MLVNSCVQETKWMFIDVKFSKKKFYLGQALAFLSEFVF